MMKAISIAGTPLRVSEISLGVMPWGTATDLDQSLALYDTYREAGGNVLDSAHLYAAIKSECEALKLRATRADEETGSGFIIGDITVLIERAEFLVCDLSEARPNVYYELGYAHGVGNEADEILLVARVGTTLHFDIAPLRVHMYQDVCELKQIVRTQLSRMIAITR